MSKFLKLFVPAVLGWGGVLAIAYVAADQFVTDIPAPLRETVAVQTAQAQTAQAQTAPTEEPATDEQPAEQSASPQAAMEPAPGQMAAAVTETPAPARDGGYGLGRDALPEEVAAWDIDVRPDGLGLPVGSGDVFTGEDIWVDRCAACHGDFGEAVGRWPVIAGGEGTLRNDDPVKTVGSYWPYASTVWDYVHRAMPFGDAQSLTADEVYALTAYILYSNYIVEDDFTLSNENFLDVVMPNADGFIPDDRLDTEFPLFSGEVCMEGCNDAVEISMHATNLDVTPDVADDAPAGEPAATPEPEATTTPEPEATTTPEPEAATTPEPEAATAPEPEATVAPEPEATDAAAEGAVTAAAPDPALVAAGETVFRRCQSCHQIGEGAVNRTGPHLTGVFGRTAGTLEGFNYSRQMVDAGAGGLVWTDETVAAYLADPRGQVQGTRMAFPGLRDPAEIEAVIAYLHSVGD